ncbi:uncharacterized protein LOC141753336 isoform X1 [Sebastes fasciatus]|uniref:uncharacterized protein LOC141753336 isoform X1 n=2 Tax=Sebastes fasciatus TaxID=394691 RepID=UPI003D9F34C6
MDKNLDTTITLPASTKKYVLYKMPADWDTLPVYSGVDATIRRDSFAVYTKNRGGRSLVYEGYVRPPTPEELSMSTVLRPPRQETFTKKYKTLLQKIRADEAEAEAQEHITLEYERGSVAGFAASSDPREGVIVRAEPRTTPGVEETADGSEQQIETEKRNKAENPNVSLQRTKSNTDYSLPMEILDRRESFHPAPPGGGTGEILSFTSWDIEYKELLNLLYADPDPSQNSSAPPVTAEDGESFPKIYLDL